MPVADLEEDMVVLPPVICQPTIEMAIQKIVTKKYRGVHL